MTKFDLGALAMRETIAKMADTIADFHKGRHEGHRHNADWVIDARDSEKLFRDFAQSIRATPIPKVD